MKLGGRDRAPNAAVAAAGSSQVFVQLADIFAWCCLCCIGSLIRVSKFCKHLPCLLARGFQNVLQRLRIACCVFAVAVHYCEMLASHHFRYPVFNLAWHFPHQFISSRRVWGLSPERDHLNVCVGVSGDAFCKASALRMLPVCLFLGWLDVVTNST